MGCPFVCRAMWAKYQICTYTYSPSLIHVHVQKWIYVHGHDHSQLLLHSYEHALYPPPPPTYHLVWFFSVASYQLAGDPLPFSSFFCHHRSRFHFFFPIQNRNVTSLSACPPTHTHVHTKGTHRETEMRAPCGHAFFCLPVSNIKKMIEGRRERRNVEGRGGEAERGRLIGTDGWREHMLCFVSLCVWETVITVSERDRRRRKEWA